MTATLLAGYWLSESGGLLRTHSPESLESRHDNGKTGSGQDQSPIAISEKNQSPDSLRIKVVPPAVSAWSKANLRSALETSGLDERERAMLAFHMSIACLPLASEHPALHAQRKKEVMAQGFYDELALYCGDFADDLAVDALQESIPGLYQFASGHERSMYASDDHLVGSDDKKRIAIQKLRSSVSYVELYEAAFYLSSNGYFRAPHGGDAFNWSYLHLESAIDLVVCSLTANCGPRSPFTLRVCARSLQLHSGGCPQPMGYVEALRANLIASDFDAAMSLFRQIMALRNGR